MKTSIRLDTSILNTENQSGVTRYTHLLKQALESSENVQFSAISLSSSLFRIYNKLHSHGISLPIDLFLPKVDLTIFPNFSTWPTLKSSYSAVVIHDLTYIYFPEVVEEKNLAHLQRVVPHSIREADIVITVSESVKKEILENFDIPSNRCIVTPIQPHATFFKAVDTSVLKAIEEKHSLDKKYIYFIGNFEPRKNLGTLIEAYRLLPLETKEEYSLVLAGSKGWKNEETEKALEDALAAGEDIRHLGFIDQADSPALYQGASLFVMPSLYEGFGMPVLEALASGTPVVAADIPVFREIGSTYVSYADPLDAQSLAKAISAALEKPAIDTRSVNNHLGRYSWEKNIRTINEAVRSLTQQV